MKTWKIAIIGCGAIAEGFYIPGLETIPRTELVAVCDIIPERAKDYAERFKVPNYYTSIDELLEKCDFEILLDLASIPAHHEINMKALKAGKHLYSQKPVGLTVEQVSEQIQAAKDAGVKFSASPIHPMRNDLLFVKDMLADGTIGKVTMVRANSAHGGPEHFQYRDVDPSWFYEPGAGALYDMGVHGLTMAIAVLGPAKEVSCMSAISQPERTIRTGAFDGKKIKSDKLPDNYIITLNWGDGCIGVVDSGFCQLASTVNMLEIYGTKGTITILGSVRIGESDGIRMFLDSPDIKVRGWIDPLPQDRTPRGPVEQHEAISDLIEAIEKDTVPFLNPEIARHVVDIMCTIPKASAEKRTLPLNTTF